MTRLHLSSWFNRFARPQPRKRRPSGTLIRRRSRPVLESLEVRWVPSTVTNLTDHDLGSLRDAIAITPAGGTVDFQPGLSGTINLTTGELGISKNLAISGPGADVITVSQNKASRVFNIVAPFNVRISGLTVANGWSPNGGDIYNSGILSISGLTITNGWAIDVGAVGEGGGLYNAGGTLTITDCTVSSNHAGFNGGGIENSGGTMTITHSTIAGNFSGGGGGIVNAGTMTITYSTISGNNATTGGSGGIGNFGTLNVSNSTVSDNYSNNYAAGMENLEGSANATFTDCTFSGNFAASGSGAALANVYGAQLTIANSTISNNSTGGYGSFGGGGIYTDGTGQIRLRDTIVAGNIDHSANSFPDVSGAISSQGHNLIGDGTGGSGYAPTDLVGTSSNPIDPKLGPLQDNGGPTFTMALLPGSPAIGAGDPTGAPEWDQRGPGYPRIVNGKIDIGAFEVQVPTVRCSVTQSLLWPPLHQLVNVGLSVDVTPPDATLHLLVYGNDHADASDATDIAPDTLRLRAKRNVLGTGRVYLIVAEASNDGGTSFDVCTVVVPRFNTPDDIASVQLQALGAETWYRQYQTAPPGFSLIGGQTSSRYDAAADFSATDNPNGAWSYGWSSTLGSAFVLDTETRVRDAIDHWVSNQEGTFNEPFVAHNGMDQVIQSLTFIYQPGELGFHPGMDGQYAVVRWTAPDDGVISIATAFTGLDYVGPTTTDVHILHNGSAFFDGIVNGFGPGSGPTFTGNMTVTAGDTIDFAVGFGPDGDYYYDTTGLDATITLSPAGPEGNRSAAPALIAPLDRRLINLGTGSTVEPLEATVRLVTHGNDPVGPMDTAGTLADQPAHPEAVSTPAAILTGRHAQDAVFAGWDTVTDGLALTWT
jgi:hypothetical protein